MKGKVYLIGIGSGNAQDITPRAVKVIKEAQVIIGHRNSLDSLKGLNPGGQMIDCPMSPLERSAAAVEAARGGSTVAIVSSGDPGIYAIGSTFFNYLQQQGLDLDVEVVPGITAASDAASLLGAPLGNDFAVVSLADQAGDWQTALQRIVAAAQADFVLVIYNPLGKIGLIRFRQVCQALNNCRRPDTPVGLVSKLGYPGLTHRVSCLGTLPDEDISEDTLVIIGNTSTFLYNGWMITPRPYQPGLGY